MTWNGFHWMIGAIVGLVWFSRVLDAAWGMPTVDDIARPEWDRKPGANARVTIIVPARDEEAHIEPTLTQLLSLDHENYEIIAVDDRSSDNTGRIMDRIAANPTARSILRVIHINQLPPDWLGKTFAMWTAAEQASGDWLLFTDADVLFKRDSLRRALAYAEAKKADHVVVLPRMIMEAVGERMMMAFFQSLFVFGHRPWKVSDPSSGDHMGVGAFNLVRRSVYEKVGTYRRLRLEVLDDMKLGKVVKEAGFRQCNVFGEDLISLHWAKGAFGLVRNLSKNMFATVSFQWPRALASCLALALLNLMPFIGIAVAHGWARLPYALALCSILLIYLGMSRKSAIRPYYFVLHPLGATLFLYAVIRSMYLTLRQGGVVWRGTKYPLEQLRKGLV